MSEPTVSTNAPDQPGLLGGAPTTTMNVSGQIPAPVQPAASAQPAPTTSPSAQPAPAATAPAAPATTAPVQQPKPMPHEIFKSVLTALGGGQQFINRVDPTTGVTTREEVPQSKGQLMRNILAGALTGLAAGAYARSGQDKEGAGGRPDAALGFGRGFAAGGGLIQNRNAAAQQESDDQTKNRQLAIANNFKTMQNMMASTMAQHAALSKQIEGNAPLIASAKDYDSNRNPNDPQAVVAENQTQEEVMAKMKENRGWSSYQVLPSGTTSVLNTETGKQEDHPVYAIVNSAVKVPLSKDAVDVLALSNPAYADAWTRTGGKVTVPMAMAVSVRTEQATVHNTQGALDKIAAEFPNSKPVDLMALVSKDHTLLKTLDNVEKQMGTGKPLYTQLDALRAAPNGVKILDALGITPGQADTYINKKVDERTREAKLAQEGGIGDKAPAPQAMVDAVVAQAKKLPADQQGAILSGVNPQGMTTGELEKLKDKVLASVQQNRTEVDKKETERLKQGDSTQISKTASNIIEGDVNDISKITSLRGNARETLTNAIHDEATRRGMDTTQYSQAALANKAKTLDDYSGNKKGSTGAQITSFNAFLGHTAGAVDAEKRLEDKTLGLTRSPWVNTAMDTLGKQVTNDPDWKAYQTSLLPVQNEISNFLSAGYAVKAEDAALMHQAVDPHETPARVTAALRQLAETADIRLQAMGQRYLDTMGTTYPHLMSVDSSNTLKRLNIPSKADGLSQSLPRGWNNGQAQKLIDQGIAKKFVQAAGGDNAKAAEIAKAHGWSL